jgi:hypothetical protein
MVGGCERSDDCASSGAHSTRLHDLVHQSPHDFDHATALIQEVSPMIIGHWPRLRYWKRGVPAAFRALIDGGGVVAGDGGSAIRVPADIGGSWQKLS